jgi:hypothetical protein
MNIDETIARAFVQGDITDTAFRAYLLSRRLNDRLEWTLGDGVCSGRLDAHEAQQAISEHWTEAYKRFVRDSQE